MTIKDIACLSGYGVGTVSRVLNHQSGVSDKARREIIAIVEEYNFQPNTNAKHLKSQSTTSLVIIIKGTFNILFADLLEKIQNRLRTYDEPASVSYLDEDANEIAYAIQTCKERNPKGILFLGGNLTYFEEAFEQIKVPCVLFTTNSKHLEFSNLSSVSIDDEAASLRVIDFLINQGHTNIGVVGGNLLGTQISYQRLQGCKQGFLKHDILFDMDLQYEPCRFSLQDGYQASMQLLNRNPKMTAIFAMSDVIALGAVRAVTDLKKRIPEDISIVGFDGISISNYSIPRLTTVYQDTEQLAQQGVDILMKEIAGEQIVEHKVIAFQLLERESVQKMRNE